MSRSRFDRSGTSTLPIDPLSGRPFEAKPPSRRSSGSATIERPVKGTVVFVLAHPFGKIIDNNTLQTTALANMFHEQGFQVALVYDGALPPGKSENDQVRARLAMDTQVKDRLTGKRIPEAGSMIVHRAKDESLLNALRRVHSSTDVLAVIAQFDPRVRAPEMLADTAKQAFTEVGNPPAVAHISGLAMYLHDKLGTYDTQPGFLQLFDAVLAPKSSKKEVDVAGTVIKHLRDSAMTTPGQVPVMDENGQPRVAAIPPRKRTRSVLFDDPKTPSSVNESNEFAKAALEACGLGRFFEAEKVPTQEVGRDVSDAPVGAPHSLGPPAVAATYGAGAQI